MVSGGGPLDEDAKTAIGPRPVFDDEPDEAGASKPSRGPTVTRSPVPRLDLPPPPAPSGLRLPAPPPAPKRPALHPEPARGAKRSEIPILSGPEPGFSTAGPLSIIAVVVVLAVAAVFVRGTQSPEERALSTASVPRPAGVRRPPEVPRNWQDRYRSDHPELLVASPKLPWLPPSERPTVRRWARAARPRSDGNQWTSERAAKTPLWSAAALDPATPSYPGVNPPKDRITSPPPLLRVISIPPGARVEVGGQVLGVTPWARGRPPDWRPDPATLSLPGWRAVTRPFEEDGNGNLVIEVRLEPDPAADPRLRGEAGALTPRK